MPQPADIPPSFRYIDEDEFCLSARLLPDLTTGAPTDMVSITIEGSDEPQSAHVPVTDLPQILAGIAAAAGLQARQVLGTTTDTDTTPPAPAATEVCTVHGPGCRVVTWTPAAPPATDRAADRRDRYAAAIRDNDGWVLDGGQHMLDAVIAVADAEQAALRAEVEGLDEALRGAISVSEKDGARVRADRDWWKQQAHAALSHPAETRREVALREAATMLTEAERTMLTYALDHAQERIWSDDGFTNEDQAAVTSLRRLADEAQQPTTAEGCACPHPAGEHSVYGCADDCDCEWMPKPTTASTEEPTR